MNNTRVGQSGLQVSRPILGTLGFGTTIPAADAHKMLDAAYELGIRTIDTANVYGQGEAEKIIGKWLALRDREEIVLCTKGYGRMDPQIDSFGAGAKHISQSFEESLARLQVSYVDVYYVHHSDPKVPWWETLESLKTLKRRGMLHYIGTSNMAGWEIADLCMLNICPPVPRNIVHQMPYNLMNRHAEQEVLPACTNYGIGAVAYSPLAGGQLTKHTDSTDRSFTDQCWDWGLPPDQVSLAWVLAQPSISGVVIGPRTLEQLYSCNEACNVTLTRDQLSALDKLFPPAGRSPGTWSW
jgi:aryl-alcohol dehydrogenase-like predicted oxidoreductase